MYLYAHILYYLVGWDLTSWGSYGSANGQFDSPSDIAVDSSGNVYVVDMSINRVQKFNSDGNFITSWGEHSVINYTGFTSQAYLNGIAVDSSASKDIINYLLCASIS